MVFPLHAYDVATSICWADLQSTRHLFCSQDGNNFWGASPTVNKHQRGLSVYNSTGITAFTSDPH